MIWWKVQVVAGGFFSGLESPVLIILQEITRYFWPILVVK
jgi:hypothetical protein